VDLVYRGVSPLIADEISEYALSLGYNCGVAHIYQLTTIAILQTKDIQFLNLFISRVINCVEPHLDFNDSWGEAGPVDFTMKSDFSLNLKTVKDIIKQTLHEFIYSEIPNEYKMQLVTILQKVHTTNKNFQIDSNIQQKLKSTHQESLIESVWKTQNLPLDFSLKFKILLEKSSTITHAKILVQILSEQTFNDELWKLLLDWLITNEFYDFIIGCLLIIDFDYETIQNLMSRIHTFHYFIVGILSSDIDFQRKAILKLNQNPAPELMFCYKLCAAKGLYNKLGKGLKCKIDGRFRKQILTVMMRNTNDKLGILGMFYGGDLRITFRRSVKLQLKLAMEARDEFSVDLGDAIGAVGTEMFWDLVIQKALLGMGFLDLVEGYIEELENIMQ
jgi:hypothetical protein